MVIVGFNHYDMDDLFEKQEMFYERDQQETLHFLNSMMGADYPSTIAKIQNEQNQQLKQIPDILHDHASEVFKQYTKVLGYIYQTLQECGVLTDTPWCILKIVDDKTLLMKRIRNGHFIMPE